MRSRLLSSTTSNAGKEDDSLPPSFPDENEASSGRDGSQSADEDAPARPSTADPLPNTSGVLCTSPHVIIGSSFGSFLLTLPPAPGRINGVMATNVSFSRFLAF